MVVLIVLGWLFLCAVAIGFTVQFFGLSYLSLGFSGVWDPILLIPAVLAALSWWAVYATFPFQVAITAIK